MIPPKDIGSAVAEGTGVPADFTLPWNSTRTLAQAWTPDNRKTHVKKGLGRPKGILVSPKAAYAGREE